jgi:hypothetical protein
MPSDDELGLLRHYLPITLVIAAGCLLSILSFNVVATTESEQA